MTAIPLFLACGLLRLARAATTATWSGWRGCGGAVCDRMQASRAACANGCPAAGSRCMQAHIELAGRPARARRGPADLDKRLASIPIEVECPARRSHCTARRSIPRRGSERSL